MLAFPRRADVVVPAIRDFVGRMGAVTMLDQGAGPAAGLRSSRPVDLSIPLKRKKPAGASL